MAAECGAAMLVFCGSTLDAHNTVAWIIHSFAHSSLDEMSAQGMMGFCAKDLPKIQVRPLSILFQVESRIHCSGVAGLRSPFPRWLSAGAAVCSHRPLSLSLPFHCFFKHNHSLYLIPTDQRTRLLALEQHDRVNQARPTHVSGMPASQTHGFSRGSWGGRGGAAW